MLYITTQDLIDRFSLGEIIRISDQTDDGDTSSTAITQAPIDAAISDVSSEIDGYVKAGGYLMPLTEAPPLLVRVASDLTRYYLSANPEEGSIVFSRKEKAVEVLEAIASKSVKLLKSDGSDFELTAPISSATSTPASKEVSVSSEDGYFGRGNLNGW